MTHETIRAARPLRELTDQELLALQQVAKIPLNTHLSSPINTLALLAGVELSERDYSAATAPTHEEEMQ